MISIGYPGEVLTASDQLEDAYICKIGGFGTGIYQNKVCRLTREICGIELKCQSCGKDLFLITQFHAPFENQINRILYVFACNSTACMSQPNSWKIIRAQFPTVATTQVCKPSTEIMSIPKFGAFGAHSDNERLRSLMLSAASNSPQTSSAAPQKVASTGKNAQVNSLCFSAAALEFHETQALPSDDFVHEKRLQKTYEGSDSARSSDCSAEKYEKVKHKYYHSNFKQFHKAVSADPKQCVRYGLGAEPLFFHNDAVAQKLSNSETPRCENCSAPVRFECQLMPNLLQRLNRSKFVQKKKADLSSLDTLDQGVDYGTLLIYTCSKNCSKEGSNYVTEQYFIQEDSIYK